METTILGLPFLTVAIVTGVPLFIVALLVWWGISYRNPEEREIAGGEGRES